MLLTPDYGTGDVLVDRTSPTRQEKVLAGTYLRKTLHDPRALAVHLCTDTPPIDYTLDDSVWAGFPAYGETKPLAPQVRNLARKQGYVWTFFWISLCSYCLYSLFNNLSLGKLHWILRIQANHGKVCDNPLQGNANL